MSGVADGPDAKQLLQTVFPPLDHQVRKRMPVQIAQERVQRFLQSGLQTAGRDNRAGVGSLVEAFHQPQVRLRPSHHFAQPDLPRLSR